MEAQPFAALYALHGRALQRFVYYRVPTKADGDDILQEIALAVLTAKEAPAQPERQKAWLLGIARHKCDDYFRGRFARGALPLEEIGDAVLTQTRAGYDLREQVRETLDTLRETDRRVLTLFYLEGRPQAEIAARLGIPLGTVKSRLHTARQNFRQTYQTEGEMIMKELPLVMPDYKIEALPLPPFEVRWEELLGWFLVPRLGEKLKWAMYDFPERRRTELFEMEAVGRASVHGIEGVELRAQESNGGQHEAAPRNDDLTRGFIAQMTDTHVRLLAESHFENGVRKYFTFLDSDAFLDNWGFGEDNCGKEIALAPKGLITREGNTITCARYPAMDVVGRYAVTLNGTRHDTVCLIDLEAYNTGTCAEQFIGRDGRTVLWRRYNHDDWYKERYGGTPWSERLPDNERLTVNGKLYVHWYDCLTDAVCG